MFSAIDGVLLIFGFTLIWFFHKKLTEDHRDKIQRWSQKENLEAEVTKHSNYISAYKKAARTFSILWFLVIMNSNIYLIENWALLALFGMVISWYIFMFGGVENQFWSTKIRETPKDFQLLSEQLNRRNSNTKNILVTLLITSLVAGSWAYNDEERYREEQQSAFSTVLDLSGQGWCGNFEDIDWNGEEAVKSGGWPCIYISTVQSVDFRKENGSKEMCTLLFFDVESGSPGLESFSRDKLLEEFCLKKNQFGGWSTYALEDEIGEFVRPKLDNLVQELCRVYTYRMTEVQYSTYCSS